MRFAIYLLRKITGRQLWIIEAYKWTVARPACWVYTDLLDTISGEWSKRQTQHTGSQKLFHCE